MKPLVLVALLTLAVVAVWPLLQDGSTRQTNGPLQEGAEFAGLPADPVPGLEVSSKRGSRRDARPPDSRVSAIADTLVRDSRLSAFAATLERVTTRRKVSGSGARSLETFAKRIRAPDRTIADRMSALRGVEMWGISWAPGDEPPSGALRKAGTNLRAWRAHRAYEAAHLDGATVRALILEALLAQDASVRAHAVVRVGEHTFSAVELNPVLGQSVRSDQHVGWFTAEQVLDRLTLSSRDADDLIVDWEYAFADGGPKRCRFLVGLGARLKPAPPRLSVFLHLALGDEDRDVRASAVNALGRLGMDGRGVSHSLFHAATDPDDRVAQLANEWIETLRK